MNDVKWLNEIEPQLQKILEIVKLCEDKFQNSCFELLLKSAIERNIGFCDLNIEESRNKSLDTSIPKPKPAPNMDSLNRFSSKTGISEEMIKELIDINTGDILTYKWNKNSAKDQRLIACLLAAKNLVVNNKFEFRREELIEKCIKNGISTHNLNRNIKTTEKEFAVFQFTDEGEIRVYSRGEETVAGYLKEAYE